VQEASFAVIGAQIGLRFTAATVRVARAALPAALTLILLVMAGCFGLGAALGDWCLSRRGGPLVS